MDDFKVGDVVQFKTGGPSMLVENVRGTVCTCMWWPQCGDEWAPQPETGDFFLDTPIKLAD